MLHHLIKGLFLTGLWIFVSPASAGNVVYSHVEYRDGHYLLQLEMQVRADADAVYDVLVDFNYIYTLNDTIKQSKLLESKDKVHKVYIQTEGCIWIFCRAVRQTQKITEQPDRHLLSETIPEQSDLKFGRTLWHIRERDDESIISYRADFVPDFWVPPLIGPWLMKKRLLEEGKKTIYGIERRATDE
ncbi:MAG: hypothetical protein OEZ39_14850 [Gammaproteobacteria bacterium]|nr:hypothetical protein [Gammaproteobacteria bacterium]MDH5653132.1 hypothetical protein [Gammaproteobacteria bacterium]